MQPLRLVGGTGSPARVLALVERVLMDRTPSVRVAELVGRAVADLGAAHAFGVVGSGNFSVTNALVAAGVPFVAARHEGGAATMADAYARTSGRLPLLSVHQGCGLTNAMTGIAEAAKSRTPLLVLAADVAGSAVGSNFRIDQDALVRSVGAVPERVHSPVRPWMTSAAPTGRPATVGGRSFSTCRSMSKRPMSPRSPGSSRFPPPHGRRPSRTLAEVTGGPDQRADRPVFLAGRGAMPYGREIAALADRVGALLTTSAVAAGTFADEPYDLGICGGFATPLAAELITGRRPRGGLGLQPDQLDHPARPAPRSGRPRWCRSTTIQPPSAPAGRSISGVWVDVGLTVSAVADLLPGEDARTRYRTPDVARRLRTEGRWPQVPYTDLSSDEHDRPADLERPAGRPAARPTASWPSTPGNFMGYPAGYLAVPAAGAFCFTQSFQSIGLGLATAIGAALAPRTGCRCSAPGTAAS